MDHGLYWENDVESSLLVILKLRTNLLKMLDYEWLTYAEVGEKAMHFGASLALVGAQPRDVILLCSIANPEWYHLFPCRFA